MEYILKKEVNHYHHNKGINVDKRFSLTLIPLNGTKDKHTCRNKSKQLRECNKHYQRCDEQQLFSLIFPDKLINVLFMKNKALYEQYDGADKYTNQTYTGYDSGTWGP